MTGFCVCGGRQERLQTRLQFFERQATHVVRVQVIESCVGDACGRCAQAFEVEEVDCLLHREDLLVFVSPAETEQKVHKRFGEEALFAERSDGARAFAFRESVAVFVQHHGDVGEGGFCLLCGKYTCVDTSIVEGSLAEGVGEVIVAAYDVRDLGIVIVDDDREHVGGRAVGAEQDEVVDLRVLGGNLSLDAVVDGNSPFVRHFKPYDGAGVGGSVCGGAVAPRAFEHIAAATRLSRAASLPWCMTLS